MGIRLRVPDDWQVVRHGLSPEAGSLTLVDRRRQRLELSWLKCKNRPDLDRLIRDYRERACAELGSDRARTASLETRSFGRGWRGFRQPLEAPGSGADARALCRTVRFDEGTSRLLEAALSIEPGTAQDEALLERLLESIHIRASGDACRRWRIFDIDVTTPPHCQLVRTQVKPADVSLSFRMTDPTTGKPTSREATLRRMGMARAWYAGDPRALVQHHADGAVFTRWQELSHEGCPALLAEGTEGGPRYKRALGRLRERRVLVWLSPAENAVYELTTSSPPRDPLLPRDFEVRFDSGATDACSPAKRMEK